MVNPAGSAGSKQFFLTRWDNNLTKFFDKTNPLPKLPNDRRIYSTALTRGKKGFHAIGHNLNKYTYKAAQSLGNRMIKAAEATNPGFFGKLIGKSKLLTNLSKGLSKLGTKGGGKIPGLSTLFAIGTGVIGAYKAAKCLLKGDFAGAGHEAVKTTGMVASLMASMAVFVPGVNIVAALGLAMGVGFVGDALARKAADTLFPSVARRKKAAAELAKAQEYFNKPRLKMYG